MYKSKHFQILELASKLPTGLQDPRAFDKLMAEIDEMHEKVIENDKVGAALEAADCLYYAIKSQHANLIDHDSVMLILDAVLTHVGIDSETVYDLCIAKYSLRAAPGNPKNDQEERAAAFTILRSRGFLVE